MPLASQKVRDVAYPALVPRGCITFTAIFMVVAMIYELVLGRFNVSTVPGIIAFHLVAGFLSL